MVLTANLTPQRIIWEESLKGGHLDEVSLGLGLRGFVWITLIGLGRHSPLWAALFPVLVVLGFVEVKKITEREKHVCVPSLLLTVNVSSCLSFLP